MEPHLATAYSLTLTGGGQGLACVTASFLSLTWGLASDILGELGGAGHLVTAWGSIPLCFFAVGSSRYGAPVCRSSPTGGGG